MNYKVLVITPLVPGRLLAPSSLSYPRLVMTLDPVSKTVREFDINMNFARLQRIFIENYQHNYDYVALVDSDVIINDRIIDTMVFCKKDNHTPCVRTKEYDTGDHIVAACSLLTAQEFIKVKYTNKPYECPCMKYPNTYYLEGISTTEIKE